MNSQHISSNVCFYKYNLINCSRILLSIVKMLSWLDSYCTLDCSESFCFWVFSFLILSLSVSFTKIGLLWGTKKSHLCYQTWRLVGIMPICSILFNVLSSYLVSLVSRNNQWNKPASLLPWQQQHHLQRTGLEFRRLDRHIHTYNQTHLSVEEAYNHYS